MTPSRHDDETRRQVREKLANIVAECEWGFKHTHGPHIDIRQTDEALLNAQRFAREALALLAQPATGAGSAEPPLDAIRDAAGLAGSEARRWENHSDRRTHDHWEGVCIKLNAFLLGHAATAAGSAEPTQEPEYGSFLAAAGQAELYRTALTRIATELNSVHEPEHGRDQRPPMVVALERWAACIETAKAALDNDLPWLAGPEPKAPEPSGRAQEPQPALLPQDGDAPQPERT